MAARGVSCCDVVGGHRQRGAQRHGHTFALRGTAACGARIPRRESGGNPRLGAGKGGVFRWYICSHTLTRSFLSLLSAVLFSPFSISLCINRYVLSCSIGDCVWVLTGVFSFLGKVDQSLNLRECDKCNAKIYEASLVCHSCKSVSTPCIVSGACASSPPRRGYANSESW